MPAATFAYNACAQMSIEETPTLQRPEGKKDEEKTTESWTALLVYSSKQAQIRFKSNGHDVLLAFSHLFYATLGETTLGISKARIEN
jgi:hypothetical protein